MFSSEEREGFSVREGGCKFSIENILGPLSSPLSQSLSGSHKDPVNYTDISEDELEVDEDDSDEDSPHIR